MQNRLLLALASLLIGTTFAVAVSHAQSASSTTLYRWVDENGVIHFSDSPRPGTTDPSADEYQVRSPNVSRSTTRRSRPATEPGTLDDDGDANAAPLAAPGYQSLSITSPQAGDTLWNIGGTLTVSLDLSPGLQAGDGIIVLMDGQLMTPRPATTTRVTLSNVYRGEHVLVAAVRNAGGQQVIASQPVRFVVQQSTVN